MDEPVGYCGGKDAGVLEQVMAEFWTSILRYFFSGSI